MSIPFEANLDSISSLNILQGLSPLATHFSEAYICLRRVMISSLALSNS